MQRDCTNEPHFPAVEKGNHIHLLPPLEVAVLVLIDEPKIVANFVMPPFIVRVNDIVFGVVHVCPVQSGKHLPSNQFEAAIHEHLDIIRITEVQGSIQNIISLTLLVFISNILNACAGFRLFIEFLNFGHYLLLLGFVL